MGSWVMSRNRDALLKRQSIPRLESSGAIVGVRLCTFVVKTLELSDSVQCFNW